MTYDEQLARRIRSYLEGETGFSEKRMFGGLAFLINGHMAVSASSQGGLLLRVDPASTDGLVTDPHARRAVMRGRELDGWLRVDADAVTSDEDLARWVAHGLGYARSLPPR